MSGTWAMRKGQVFIPLQFAATKMIGTKVVHTSAANIIHTTMSGFIVSKGFRFPNNAITGPVGPGGGVTATGMTPATLKIPKHRFVQNFKAAVPLAGVTLVQITTMFVVDAPYQKATFMKNGGPGNFTWCWSNPACTAAGPPNTGGKNGRVIYKKGANQFGGTMQVGLGNGGINSFLFQAVPFRAGHAYFGQPGPTLRNLAVGGGKNDVPHTELVYLKAGVVTQPLVPPTSNGLIYYPGPKVTKAGKLTNTMPSQPLLTIKIGTSVMGQKFAQKTTNFGFPHTTGTVIAQQTTGTGGQDFFTWKGTDMRTALGAGNISTVAGGLAKRNTGRGATRYAQNDKVWMSLGAPIPSMSPAGFAAAGALMLLAVGYALRRRIA